MLFGLGWGWTWSDLFPGCQPCLTDFLSFFPMSTIVSATFVSFCHVTKSTGWPFKRELAKGSTSAFRWLRTAAEVRHLFKGGLFAGQKGNSSAAQPLFGSLFWSSASILVHVILIRWTSCCRVYPLVSLCLPVQFVGNISPLRSECFGKLSRICRLLSKVCWEMILHYGGIATQISSTLYQMQLPCE